MKKQAKPERRNQKTVSIKQKETSSGEENGQHSVGRPFPIVGIGASAGGLEALELFLRNVPPESGMAYTDCVYVIPPNKDMSILHGVLHLLDPVALRGLRLPIDFFFRSLADDAEERSNCI